MGIKKCEKCDIDCICPICNFDKFNRPLVVKYLDDIVAITEVICAKCHVELYTCIDYKMKTLNHSYCFICSFEVEEKAYKYDGVCK